MARQRNYAAEYARRQERGRQLGRTRQEARGHRPAEHVARAEREREERGISSYEERTVRAWGKRRAAKNKDLDPQDLVDWAAAHGYRAFKGLRHQQEAAHRQYKQDVRRKRYVSTGPGNLTSYYGSGGGGGSGSGPAAFGPGLEYDVDYEDFDFDFDVEDLPLGWLYYH